MNIQKKNPNINSVALRNTSEMLQNKNSTKHVTQTQTIECTVTPQDKDCRLKNKVFCVHFPKQGAPTILAD